MDVSQLKQQHDEIAGVARQLSAAVANLRQHQPTAAIRWQLARLLMTHLAMEDRLFYPAMERLPDAQANSTAAAFKSEMGGLADAFTAYMSRWTDERVEAHWPAFCVDTQSVLDALAERVERENGELYPLAERLPLASGRRRVG